MAAIEAIPKNGTGMGQAGGKTAAGAVTGFDLLFAVSSEGADLGDASASVPFFADNALADVEMGAENTADLDLILGFQTKAELSPKVSILPEVAMLADIVPDLAMLADSVPDKIMLAEIAPDVAILPGVIPEMQVGQTDATPIHKPVLDLSTQQSGPDHVDHPVFVVQTLPQTLSQNESAPIVDGLDLDTKSDEKDDKLPDLLPDELEDPDERQAAAALASTATLQPPKALIENSAQTAASVTPPLQIPVPTPTVKPSPTLVKPFLQVAQDSDDAPSAAPLDPSSPIARIKINIDPVTVAPRVAAHMPPAVAQGTTGNPSENPMPESADLASLRDAEVDQPQAAAGPKQAQLTATNGDLVQAKLPPAAVSTAPLMAQLRQTLDTRDAAWRERLVDQVVGNSSSKTQTITVMLRPKSLGDMQLQVDVGQSDTAVRIVTETASAARLMMANEDMLSQLMEQSGVRLASLTAQSVGQNSLMGQSFGQSMAQNSGGQGGRDAASPRKDRVRGAVAARTNPEPILKLGDNSKSSINLMA